MNNVSGFVHDDLLKYQPQFYKYRQNQSEAHMWREWVDLLNTASSTYIYQQLYGHM